MTGVDGRGRPRGLILLLTVLALFGAVALVLSIANAAAINDEAEAREADRIEADNEACERGNDLRRRVIELGKATDELVSRVLDDVDAVDRFAGPLRDYRRQVESIEVIDCPAVTPGSTPEENP